MKKLLAVTITGFPNVGKSTLFNRILKRKKSLVHSLPGMTRDVVTGIAEYMGKNFELIDTGGLWGENDLLNEKIKNKALEYAKKSSVILFVLDSKRDALYSEIEMFRELKKLNIPIFLIINKIDSPSHEQRIYNFYQFGEEHMIPVSAEHGIGIEKLLDSILPFFSSDTQDSMTKPIKIAIVGRANVGKSSIINKILGWEKMIVNEQPGTTRDAVDSLVIRNKVPFLLLDTAGIKKLKKVEDEREAASIIRSKKIIKEADVVCLVIDSNDGILKGDLYIGRHALELKKPLIIAFNKWDLIKDELKFIEKINMIFKQKTSFLDYGVKIYISALEGRKVFNILDVALDIHKKLNKKIDSGIIKKEFEKIFTENPPVSEKKETLKIRFVLEKRKTPLTFILFSSKNARLLGNYEKFLEKKVREKFKLQGIPIKFIIKGKSQ